MNRRHSAAKPRGKSRGLRIIGGRWRGRRLQFVAKPGVRPTPDRVRESLFNWIQWKVRHSRCLDLFAGSGALGFEALSRGAAAVVAVEREPDVAAQLGRSARELGAPTHGVVCGEVSRYLVDYRGEPFDFIFADAPFDQSWSVKLLTLLSDSGACGSKTRVYLESGQPLEALIADCGWRCFKTGRAGRVHYCLAGKRSASKLA